MISRIDTARTGIAARLLATYQLGPEHPSKLRIWRWLHSLAGDPLITVNYADAALLELDCRDVVQSTILRDGFYEREVWDALASLAESDEVVWDVGGHIGSVAIRAALDSRIAVVHAFEPHPGTSARFRRNLALNPTLPVVLHTIALGDRVEDRSFSEIDPGNIGAASLALGHGATGARVHCLPADDVEAMGQAPAPTLMKIDIEGFELPMLQGATRMLNDHRLKGVVFEAETSAAGQPSDQALIAIFRSAGFQVQRILRPNGSLTPRENFLAARAMASTSDCLASIE